MQGTTLDGLAHGKTTKDNTFEDQSFRRRCEIDQESAFKARGIKQDCLLRQPV